MTASTDPGSLSCDTHRHPSRDIAMNAIRSPALSYTADEEWEAFGMLPWDEANRQLVANVHPGDWQNPRAKSRYHLVVVGGGTAGLVTAAIATALGARVALVERKLLGGDCLNVGCVPSKALIRSARAWRAAAEAAPRFGGPEVHGPGDFGSAMARMREIRAGISSHDSAARFRDLGVDVFLGDGTFTGPDALDVDGQTLRFRRAVIAAGSRPAAPDIPGLAEAGYLTNESLFTLTELPERLAVIGGGPIGCEMAQAFSHFGSRVTMLEAADRILSNDDADAAGVVHEALVASGVKILCGAAVSGVEAAEGRRAIHFTAAGSAETLVVDEILVSVGRSPNVEGLGLEAAKVSYDQRKGVETDGRMRTSNRRIYAIGDIASRLHFTHAADAQARMVVRNALFFGRSDSGDLLIPWCTYTTPELAHVGISAEEVRQRRDEIDTITVPLEQVDRARLDGSTDGFFRVHLKAGSDQILGATLVADHAGDIISQITQAMGSGTGLGELGETIFPYPTQAEVIRKAADQWRRRKLTPLARRGFGLFFRALR
jgi:pyruvate/2-oxoglutarate dehydrogenase complex dihydrolipoamide dehydrogenase (E3) component